ncbi:MAG: hypothetical protein ACLQBK_24550 [Candidatus Sulfotelmatobacter sp.]
MQQLQALRPTLGDLSNYRCCRRSLQQAIKELEMLLRAEGTEPPGESAEGKESMPTQYVIDIDNHIVQTRFSGLVTHHDVADHAARLHDDPAFDPQFSELVTFGEDPDIQLSYLDWQSLADRDPFSTSSMRAFVVQPRCAVYGVVRMCQIARNNPPNICIFETVEEALSWLCARRVALLRKDDRAFC